MQTRLIGAALIVAALSAPAFAQTENLQLFREVQAQVLRYPHFTVFDSVNAQVTDGIVTLTGKVTMPYKREDIARRVSGIRGIRNVKNDIDVLPVSPFDDQLRFAVARAIYSHPVFHRYSSLVNPPIHIIVERGQITLEGVVNSDLERLLARSIAGSFLAFDLRNDLKTDAEVKELLERL